jgi:hypothetical protein
MIAPTTIGSVHRLSKRCADGHMHDDLIIDLVDKAEHIKEHRYHHDTAANAQ